MIEALWWGVIASSSLLLGGVIALVFRISARLLGLRDGVRRGRADQLGQLRARRGRLQHLAPASGSASGSPPARCSTWATRCSTARRADESSPPGQQASGSALAIVLGIVLDGIPESIVLGLTVLEAADGVSVAFLAAVFLSNLPEAIAATTGLRAVGWRGATSSACGPWWRSSAAWRRSRVRHLDAASTRDLAFVRASAGGAILTMLADTMMPEAFEHGGKLVGVFTDRGDSRSPSPLSALQ